MTKANYTLLHPKYVDNTYKYTNSTITKEAVLFELSSFKQYNITLAAWTTSDTNGYVAVKAQLINDNLQGLAPVQQIARFNSIDYLKTETFDDGTALIAWSSKVPNKNQSSILITYSNPDKPKMFHVYPSLDGKFELVATTEQNIKKFTVSYMRNETAFSIREYQTLDSQNISVTNKTIINPKLKCNTGCDLNSPDLENLSNYVGIKLNSTIMNIFFPRRQDNITFYNPSHTLIAGLHSKHFYNSNSSLIIFVYEKTSNLEIKAQFFDISNSQPLGFEQNIGYFREISNVQITGFNETSILIAYTVKQNLLDQYTLIVEYISPNFTKVVNLLSSYSGYFSMDTVPNSNDFMVVYNTDSSIQIKQYSITPHDQVFFIEKLTITQSNLAVHTIMQMDLKAFEDHSCNLIWSSINTTEIQINRYNLTDGSSIANQSIPLRNVSLLSPDHFLVDTDNNNTTVLAWQESESSIFATIISNYNISTMSIITVGDNAVLTRIKCIDNGSFLIDTLSTHNNTIFTNTTIYTAEAQRLWHKEFEYSDHGALVPLHGIIDTEKDGE